MLNDIIYFMCLSKLKFFVIAFTPMLLLALALLFSACGKNDTDSHSIKKSNSIVTNSLTNRSRVKKKNKQKLRVKKRNEKIEKILPAFAKVLINGKSATGVVVSLTANFRKKELWFYSETQSNGVAYFQVPASARKIKITASHPGYLNAVYFAKNFNPDDKELSIILNLTEKGVVITACIIAEDGLPSSNIISRIISTDNQRIPALRKAVSTNIYDGEIIFSPIPVNLKNLCVSLKCEDMTECFSEVFDTVDEEDKTVIILAPSTSKLYGKAIFSDGTPVDFFKLNAKPVNDEQGKFQSGKINKEIYTDKYGTYFCPGLIPAYYNINIKSKFNADIHTNLWITEGVNYFDITFDKLPFVTLYGSTLFANSDEPLTNVAVTFTSYLGDKSQRVLSDDFGNFDFDILISPGKQPGELKAEKKDFCNTIAYLSKSYAGQKVILKLFKTSSITGKVFNIDKRPVAGVNVSAKSFSPDQKNGKKSDKDMVIQNADPGFTLQYGGVTKFPTTENGDYIIEDIAAPETYLVDIASPWCFTMNKFDPEINVVNVKPEKPTLHNLYVYTKNVILVKALNEEETPVEQYDLQINARTDDSQKPKNIKINHHGEEWIPVSVDDKLCHPKAEVTFTASTKTAESNESEPVKLCGVSTNYVILKLVQEEPQIAGHVYMPDKMPAVNASVMARAKASGSRANAKADHIGYFEIRGLNCIDNEMVFLNTSLRKQKASAVTNVPAGSLNVEIYLHKPQFVIGRVFYENYSTPASNFFVSLTANKNTGKEFTSPDGSFIFYINSRQAFTDKGDVYITATGFSPEKVEVSFEYDEECDVGDILLNNKYATVKGKVVDQDKTPVFADVFVRLLDSSIRMKNVSTQSDQNEGTFTFNELPVEEMYLEARTRVGKAVSEPFTPESGEITIVPDLIIGTTNGIFVNLKFVLPNGNPAAKMYVEMFRSATDRNGNLKLWLKPGKFRSTKVFSSFVPKEKSIGAKTDANLIYYLTIPFTIDEETKEQIVQLESTSRITGIAFVNGNRYDGTLQFKLIPQNTTFRAVAHDGIFKLNAMPGKYIVSCRPFKTAVSVVLKNGVQNRINFISGNGKIELFFPWKGDWRASIRLMVDGYYVNVAGGRKSNISRMDFPGMPPGKFSIAVTGFLKSGTTNFSKKTELYQDGLISISF